MNRIDPSGLQSPNNPPSYCHSPQWPEDTRWKDDPVCQQWRGISTPTPPPTSTFTPPHEIMPNPHNVCQPCRPQGVFNGYSESDLTMLIIGRSMNLHGRELVFDFATLEMGEFSVHTDFDYPGYDIGIVSFDRVYEVSFIKGFTPEPGDHLVEDYGPRVVNVSAGVSAGAWIHLEVGLQGWTAENGSLSGGGYWYGGEVSGLDFATSMPIFFATGIPFSVGPEFSYNKTYTSLLNYSNLGDDICNREEASKMLQALQIYPNYNIGQWPGRQMAIQHFKSYASLD